MNRITEKFRSLKSQQRKALIAFITAGYPNIESTVRLVPALEKAGADIIELGIPFSDPIADGPTIQDSSYQALRKNLTLKKIWAAVAKIRRISQVPIALMTYYNPIYHYGEKEFIRQSRLAGADGIIVPDLTLAEANSFRAHARSLGMATVFFVSPATPDQRIRRIADASSGFVYYISLTGVTGARARLPVDLVKKIKTVKRYSKKPVCVGFGISQPAQVRQIAKIADGVIVGSAIIKEIKRCQSKKDMVPRVAHFVNGLAQALRSSF